MKQWKLGHKFHGVDAQDFHLLFDEGEVVLEEFAALFGEDFLFGVGADEVAHASAVVDNLIALQELEGTHHRVWVDAHELCHVAYRRNTILLPQVAGEDLLHQPVGYLQVYRFLFSEFHNDNVLVAHTVEAAPSEPAEEEKAYHGQRQLDIQQDIDNTFLSDIVDRVLQPRHHRRGVE